MIEASKLEHALQQNQIDYREAELQKLVQFLELLQKWNKVFNLTSITNLDDMIDLHIVDSLTILKHLHGSRIIDIGSGAGLPGIPLAIMRPDIECFLLDKNNKKTRFITQAAADLELKNIKVVHSRVEDFHPDQGFDSILSRAFSSLEQFCQSTQHLMNPNGLWLAMKGKEPKDELSELSSAFVFKQNIRLEIKGRDVERHLICISQKA